MTTTTDFRIFVKPRSSRTRVGGSSDGALIVRVSAPPVDGAANAAVVSALAAAFDVPARWVDLVPTTSRRKRVRISADVSGRLKELLGA